MKKIGRNEPCPCGSGLKYKKCCLDKDKANKVVRVTNGAEEQAQAAVSEVAAAVQASEPNQQSVVALIENLEWGQPQYKITAEAIVEQMTDVYEAPQVAEAVTLWNEYAGSVQPLIRKAGVYPAAIELVIAQQYERSDITRKALAQKYDVSESTISQRALDIQNFVQSKLAGA